MKSARLALVGTILLAAFGHAALPTTLLHENFETFPGNAQWEEYDAGVPSNNIELLPVTNPRSYTRGYYLSAEYGLKTTFNNNAASNRPTYFSFHFSPMTYASNKNFSASINEFYGGTEGNTGSLQVKAYNGELRLFLNNEAEPVNISGFSALDPSKWYQITAQLNYGAQTMTWRVNSTPEEDAGVARGFQWGTVLGMSVVRFKELDGGFVRLDNILFTEEQPGITLFTYYQANPTFRFANTYAVMMDRLTGKERTQWFPSDSYAMRFSWVSGLQQFTTQTSTCFEIIYDPTDRNVEIWQAQTGAYVTAHSDHNCQLGGYVVAVPQGTRVDILNTSGGVIDSKLTNAGGNFTASVPFGSYRVRVNNPCYDYWPNANDVLQMDYFFTGVSVNSQEKPCSVALSGFVSGSDVGPAVTIQATNNSTNTTTSANTNSQGIYVMNVTPGQYAVLPISACYDFSPPNQTITINSLGGSANFTGNIRKYNVTAAGANNNQFGTVTKSVANPHNCASALTLTANPIAGYRFTSWTGGPGGGNPLNMVVTANQTITANFAINTYTLSANVSANGSVTPNSGTYNYNTPLSLVVSCNSGYQFAGWTDGNSSNPRNFNITSNVNLTATCSSIPTFTLNLAAVGNGTVTPAGINTYQSGASVTLNQTAATGHRFTGWTGDLVSSSPSATITMNGNKVIRGNFAINTYTLAANVTANGSVSPSSGTYNYNTPLSLLVTCNSGYQFAGWTDGNIFLNPRNFNITSNVNLTATCTQITYELEVVSDTAELRGTFVKNPNLARYPAGSGVTVTATPTHAYRDFSYITCPVQGTYFWTNPFTIPMNDNMHCVAKFGLKAPFIDAFETSASQDYWDGWGFTPTPIDGSNAMRVPEPVASNSEVHAPVHGAVSAISYRFRAESFTPGELRIWSDVMGPQEMKTVAQLTVGSNGQLLLNSQATTIAGVTPITVGRWYKVKLEILYGSNQIRWTLNDATPITQSISIATGTRLVMSHMRNGGDIYMDDFFAGFGYRVVSGRISGAGAGIQVTLRDVLTGGQISATTNSTGDYSFNGVATGRYVVTPSASGQSFSPASSNITIGGSDVVANFSLLANYTLTLSYINGSITKSPNQPTYVHGSTVTLTPVPNANYSFTGWSGSAAGAGNPLPLLMDGNKTVAANFTLINRLLTTPAATGGSITRSLPGPSYPHGDEVELTAVPQTGYTFVRWGTDGTGTYPVLKVKMDRAKTVTAVFAVTNVRLTINPSTNGSIRTQPDPVGGFYKYGQKVLLIPVPNPATQYKLTGWTGVASGTLNPYPLIMDGDKTVGATFGLIPSYTLTLTQVANGTLKASPPTGPYKEGSKVVLSSTPAANYTFGGWTGHASGTKAYILIMDGNKSVSGSFVTAPPVSLTVINNAGTNTQSVLQHAFTPISTTVPADKGFSHWEVSAKQNNKVAVKFANPNSATTATVRVSGGNATVRAVFLDPRLDVLVKDDATGGANKLLSKPVVQVKTLDAGALNDFKLRYYFKMECSRHPEMLVAPATGWSVTLNDADGNGDYGGNWYLEYVYANTLAGHSQVQTPAVTLSFVCADCNPDQVWGRHNDYSGPKKTGKWVRNTFIPVYKNAGDANSFFGQIPSLDVDPLPELVPPGENTIYPIPAPEKTDPPIPNLTFGQAFPKGDFFANGSFEHDSLGWGKWGGSYQWKVGLHSTAEGSYDGFRFLQLIPTGGAVEGAFFELPETSPAYGFLVGKKVTLAAWLRKPASTGGSAVTARLGMINNADNGSGNPLHTLNETWQFCTQTMDITAGTDFGDGVRKLRFAVLEGAAGQNLAIDLDGITLSLGENAAPPVMTVKWTNTQHNPMQSVSVLPEELFGYDPQGMRLTVSNFEYDGLGRKKKNYLPYATDCGASDCNPFFDYSRFIAQQSRANDEYRAGNTEGLPDAGNSAFTESEYVHDQLVTIGRTGLPGANFNLNSGNTVETFYSGVSSLVLSDLGQDYSNPDNRSNARYAYQYVEDENGHGVIEWKNGFGQVLRTASAVTGDAGEEMAVTDNFYDAKGNLVKTHTPTSCRDREGLPAGGPACVQAVQYEYDDEGKMIKETHPDRGVTRKFYDYFGRVRISQMAHQAAEGKFTVYRYDDLGRNFETGEYYGGNGPMTSDAAKRDSALEMPWPPMDDPAYHARVIHYYDRMPDPVPPMFIGEDPDFRLYPQELAGTFPAAKGDLMAVVTIQPPVDALNSADADKVEEISSVAYRYDKYGKVLETYTFNGFTANPAYKLQKAVSVYDAVGRLTETRNFDKADDYLPSRITLLSYDVMGRVKEVLDAAGKSIAKYEYFQHDGKLKSITLDGSDPDSLIMTYTYHIRGFLNGIKVERPLLGASRTLYNESVMFDQPTAAGAVPQYNGNISQVRYFLSQLSVPTDGERQAVYTYDELDRLRKVAFDVVDGTSNSKDNQLDAVYAYDLDGRITYQRNGSRAAQAITSGGEYVYAAGSHRLVGVASGIGDGVQPDRSGTEASPNFKYDDAGQMVQDRSKRMMVSYDYRGNPLAFSYKDASQGLLHQAVMRYDHTGSRIAKMIFDQSSAASIQFIVDVDANREREYPTLRAAYDDLRTKLALLNAHAAKLYIYVVHETSPYRVPITESNLIRSLFLQDGQHTVSVSIQGVRFNSDEYWELIGGRKEMSYSSASLYTGVGNEIRQSGSSVEAAPKVITYLPEGLGRYEPGSSEKIFNVKNHLGSTALGAHSNSASGYDVYDYAAYGKEHRAVAARVGDDKISETFTGKELDEQIGLVYFGSRFFDPELGLWITPDVVKEFHSLYAYSPNPIVSVDPDGNQTDAVLMYNAILNGRNPFSVFGSMLGKCSQRAAHDIHQSTDLRVSVREYKQELKTPTLGFGYGVQVSTSTRISLLHLNLDQVWTLKETVYTPWANASKGGQVFVGKDLVTGELRAGQREIYEAGKAVGIGKGKDKLDIEFSIGMRRDPVTKGEQFALDAAIGPVKLEFRFGAPE